MRQRTQLTVLDVYRLGRAALAALLAAFAMMTVPAVPALAIDPPGVASPRPAPRPIPMQRITPRPPPAVIAPRVAPGPTFGPNPNLGGSNVAGPNCWSSCGASCQMISCDGMKGSQCTSARQQCRTNCRSRC